MSIIIYAVPIRISPCETNCCTSKLYPIMYFSTNQRCVQLQIKDKMYQILTTENCQKCSFLEKIFKKRGVPFLSRRLTEDEIVLYRSEGHYSAPIVIKPDKNVIDFTKALQITT